MLSRRSVVAMLIAIAVVTGCDGTTRPSTQPSATAGSTPAATVSGSASPPPASAGPSEDLSAIYREINAQVQEIRGLEELAPVEPRIVSREELAEVLTREVREETPEELFLAYERLYKAMALMPREDSLVDVYADLLESQVAGLYVPTDKSLYVLSREGEVGAVERVLYSHEYEHALQDQHFDLTALQPADLVDESDRQMARQALIEGDAYVTMSFWLRDHLSPAELLEVLSASQDPETLEALEEIPPIVSNQILFPATQGLLWTMSVQSSGGWEAVDAAFDDPPDSTEQILHSDKWESREAPVVVDLPDDLAGALGNGWSETMADTMGEHQLAVWLTGAVPTGGFPQAPPEAVVGWGGDRLSFLEGPDDAWAVVVATEWDTAADAVEFHDAIVQLQDEWDSGMVFSPRDSSQVWVLIASDDDVTRRLESTLGLTGV